MKDTLPPAQLEAWRSLSRAFWGVSARLEADLADAELPTLSWYDVLRELSLAPDHHLRMCELAAKTQLSRSGLTRLVDRLEKERLLERKSCPKDGRVQHAQLTAKGVALLQQVCPLYRAGVQKYFAARLTGTELQQLTVLLQRVADELPPAPAE